VIVLSFTVTFHGPFRVGSAYARDGVDAALDRYEPLPPDHLKGLMRAAARDLLGVPAGLVGEVFGSPANPSQWFWSAAEPDGDWDFSFRHRVAICQQTRSALKDHLVLGEQAWAPAARFEVTQAGALAEEAADRQVLVLRCAASAVHGLGAWRRRGLGWVGVVPDSGPVTGPEIAELMNLTTVTR
jgi:hypothetical protein